MVSTRASRAARAGVVAVIAAMALVPVPATASGHDDLAAAQRRADRVAEELSRAEAEMAQAEDAVTRLQERVKDIDGRVALAREQVRQLAVYLYMEGTGSVSRLLRMADANQIVRAQQFSHFLAGGTADSLERYRADLADLRGEQRALERQEKSRASAFEDLRRRRSEAIKEVDRLGRAAEQARAARAADEQRARTAATAGATPSTALRPPVAAATPGRPPAAASPRPATAAPAPGGGGGGSAEWVCPVQGPRSFSNDYGAPRSGGSHQGNDILAPRGTPVVANVGGVVTQRTGAVSGLAYYLAGDDGSRYFGAHLNSFGASGRVAAGTVIGTVGDTGDAVGGPPHLHFEIHPGGRGNINPYPTLKKYC